MSFMQKSGSDLIAADFSCIFFLDPSKIRFFTFCIELRKRTTLPIDLVEARTSIDVAISRLK